MTTVTILSAPGLVLASPEGVIVAELLGHSVIRLVEPARDAFNRKVYEVLLPNEAFILRVD